MKVKASCLTFVPKCQHVNVSVKWQISVFIAYFGHTESTKFCETCYGKALCPLEHNVNGFSNKQLCRPQQMRLKFMTSQQAVAGTSRLCCNLHFLFTHFLAYQVSCHGKSSVLSIAKLLITHKRKMVFLFSAPLT